MTIAPPKTRRRSPAPRPGDPGVDRSIEIVVPVYNEQAALAPSVRRLRAYLDESFPFPAVVTIADNASTDGTWAAASDLAASVPGVRAVRLDQKGRGRALRATWAASDAAVVAYMDVDLATDLDALLPLVAPLVSGHSDVAIGTRLAPGANVVRGPKREIISRTYNLIVRAALHNGFSDAQCGFKALRADVAKRLLPLVEDQQWFFDTELLVQAERHGLRIHEVPVDWADDPDSRVDIRRTAIDDLKGVWRLMRSRGADAGVGPPTARGHDDGSLRRFAGVGIVSTVAYVVLFVLFRRVAGDYLANLVALLVCTAANSVAHSRFTFGAQPAIGYRRALVGAVAVFSTSLALTSVALAGVNLVLPTSVTAEVVALVAASGVAALCRFVLLRAWVFRAHLRGTGAAGGLPAPAPRPPGAMAAGSPAPPDPPPEGRRGEKTSSAARAGRGHLSS